MRLVSLNLWGGRAYNKLTEFVESEKLRTDIFCFQEVLDLKTGDIDPEVKAAIEEYQKSGRKQELNLYSSLRDLLTGFESFLSEPYSQGAERLAIFARKELKAQVEVLKVHRKIDVILHDKPFWVSCIMQHAQIKRGTLSYDIAQLHGLWQGGGKADTPERLEQSKTINKLMSKFGERKVLCGDFNLDINTESVRMLEDSMTDLIRTHRITTTRSTLAPARKGKIADYVFVSDKIKVNDFELPETEASDHLPLCLDFE
jgi:exonuclease III